MPEQSENDLGFAFEVERPPPRPVRRGAIAVKIRRDDPVSFAQPFGERAPLGAGAAGAVQKHHWLAAAHVEVFDAAPGNLQGRHACALDSDPTG